MRRLWESVEYWMSDEVVFRLHPRPRQCVARDRTRLTGIGPALVSPIRSSASAKALGVEIALSGFRTCATVGAMTLAEENERRYLILAAMGAPLLVTNYYGSVFLAMSALAAAMLMIGWLTLERVE